MSSLVKLSSDSQGFLLLLSFPLLGPWLDFVPDPELLLEEFRLV